MFKLDINFKLLSPLMHYGDDKLGTMQITRKLKYLIDNEFIDVPVYSGNAFRGITRRIAANDFLNKLGITEISNKLYYLLYSGGALTNGSRYEEIGERRRLRELCTPLSLFGSAIGDQIPEGKLKVSMLLPICKELKDYTGVESELSFYDMLQEVFYTRRDDLKSTENKVVVENKLKNPVQMKYEMECLAAGTELKGELVIECETEIEKSCLAATLNRFKEIPYIGGKSATGHGKVNVKYDEFSDEILYYNYLHNNKEEITNYLKLLEEKL